MAQDKLWLNPVVSVLKGQDLPVQILDVNTNFLYSIDPLILSDMRAINNQLYNLFSTRIGERPFEPEFGSDVVVYLFDPCDELTAWNIETTMFTATQRWLPRIQMIRGNNGTKVTPYPDQRMFDAQYVYSVPGINFNGQLNLNLIQPG